MNEAKLNDLAIRLDALEKRVERLINVNLFQAIELRLTSTEHKGHDGYADNLEKLLRDKPVNKAT